MEPRSGGIGVRLRASYINGANQTAGECVHVENMGVDGVGLTYLLSSNCYSNNLEIVGVFSHAVRYFKHQ